MSCVGGASAEAFAEALKQSIARDPDTGCDVLTTAWSTAEARCGESGAFASANSTVTRVGPVVKVVVCVL